MLYCYPRGIAQPPYFIEDRATLAEYLISQELTRERGVLKYRLRKAGIPFDPDSDTEELAKLVPRKPST